MANEKRLIDANALLGDIAEELAYESPVYTADQNKWIDTGLRIAAHNIRRQPTVDAAEVVRCKDCEFCYYNSSNDTYKCRSMNGMYRTVKADDFCSYGERRES